MLKRAAILFVLLLFAMSAIFGYIHLGPNAPGEATTSQGTSQAALEQKKQAFGLNRPLWVQYGDYFHDMFTLEFGNSWSSRHIVQAQRVEPTTDVNELLIKYGSETLWLWLWAFVFAAGIGLPLGVGLGFSGWTWSKSTATVGGALVRAAPVFVLALVFQQVLYQSGPVLFGFDWQSFLVSTRMTGPISLSNLSNSEEFVSAFKHVAPAALALASAFVGTMVRVGQRAVQEHQRASYTDIARAKGVRERVIAAKHVGKNTILPFVAILPISANILIGGTMVIEYIYGFNGLGVLVADAVKYGDFTTFQALMFLFILLLVVTTFLRDALYTLLAGPPNRNQRVVFGWTAPQSSTQPRRPTNTEQRTLQSVAKTATLESGVRDRIRANSRPALIWLLGAALLIAVEFGALAGFVAMLLPWESASLHELTQLPTLLSRETIPNAGHWMSTSGWVGTFLGLPPAYAWALRVGMIFLYAAGWLSLTWFGYQLYRSHYRGADRTPTDEFFARFRRHRWGLAGCLIVFVFVVSIVFAPALGPTELSRAGPQPNTSSSITYYDEQAGSVTTVSRTLANLKISNQNTEPGVGSYDRYGRFHPLGGNDLLTELLWSIRIQAYLMILIVALIGAGLLGSLGVTYRGGLVESAVGFFAELISMIPVFPAISMFSVWLATRFAESQRGDVYGPIPYWAIFVAVFSWPLIWRVIHSPASRVLSRSWLDSERSYGQRLRTIGRRFLRQVIGYVVVSLCTLMAGVFIFSAASQYVATLRIGLYYWGGLIDSISTSSGSGYLAAGFLVLFIVGFIALADGIRDSLDPDHALGTNSVEESTGTGWGG